MKVSILCGIVSYNPDLKRLEENIDAIFPQVDEILIIDNGSHNVNQLSDFLNKYNKRILLRKFKRNRGIAAALNYIMEFAISNKYDWALTLDQDSICCKDLIARYIKYTDNVSIGILTCNIIDRNFSENHISDSSAEEIPMCITSASLMRTYVYEKISGYEDRMFIDWVDFDICLQVRKVGYKVVRLNYDGVLHEVGKGKNVNFLGKSYISYNHPVFRQYYMARNHFYLVKKHPEYISLKNEIKKEIRFWMIIMLFEKNRCDKLKARMRGIKDAIKMNPKDEDVSVFDS